MNRWTVLVATVLVCLLVAVSCSGGGNPVIPASGPDGSPGDPGQPRCPQTHLWGYYDCYLDLETNTIEAVPNRTVMGVEPTPWAWNVTSFVNKPPTNLRFKINKTTVSPDETYIDVDIDVSITHPFPGLNQYNGYDVRGIFIGNGSGTLPYGDLRYAVEGVDQMVYNPRVDLPPDPCVPVMYTRWWNPTEFTFPGVLGYMKGAFATPEYNGTATLNPYEYFADGLGAEDDLWEFLTATGEHGVFKAGSINTRKFYIRFPTPSPGVRFNYAIAANWQGEDVHPANGPEAMQLTITVTDDIYYVNEGDWGGDLILDISVFDWYSHITETMPEEYSLFVCSNMFESPYELNDSEMTPTTPTDPYPTYHVEIPVTSLSGTEENEYWVVAEYHDWNYSNEYDVPNSAQEDALAAFLRSGVEVSSEPQCTDPILSHMDPDTCDTTGSLNNVHIVGDEMEEGSELACYLTNGTIDVPGTDVTWHSSQLVTADFDFGTAGATEGDYDLYFTDGDGCEVVLPDAMHLVEVSWPIEIASDRVYLGPAFVEDVDGRYHILCSVENPTGSYQIHWFHSENNGVSWTDEGDIYSNTGHPNYACHVGHTLGIDDDGGVYALIGDRTYYYIYLLYLDTATYDDPSAWQASDWESKQVISHPSRISYYHCLGVSPDGKLFGMAHHYTASERYFYANSWDDLPSSQSGSVFPTNVSGHMLQEINVSPTNAAVYDENTGTFFFALGGRWDNYHYGAYLLEFTPPGTFAWVNEFDFYMPIASGYFTECLSGGVELDSSDSLHWVHQTIWHYPPGPPYYNSRVYNEFILNYGTNYSGSWATEEPINDSANYRFPNATGLADPRNEHRPWPVNLACTSDDTLVMFWRKSNNHRSLMSATRDVSTGGFTDPPVVLLDETGDLPVYYSVQGEAVGTQVAIAFTSQGNPPSGTHGALYFAKNDGETPMD